MQDKDFFQPFQGSLFTKDFLCEAITDLPEWENLDSQTFAELESEIRELFERFPTDSRPNESQTEDDLIWPILEQIGWTASLRQQNLSSRGRTDVPDGLLFRNLKVKEQANRLEEYDRYELGSAVVESKHWRRPLDRGSEEYKNNTAPSTKMLRYLRRIDDQTEGKLRMGILTNGSQWRLYYQGARSVSEQFFEIDLARVLGVNKDLFSLSESECRHWLKVFILIFRPQAFEELPDEQTFHQHAINKSQYYQKRVSTNLSTLIFEKIFPKLVREIAKAAADASLQDVRQSTLILLYRLLFILYAEDRDLLPVNDSGYSAYSLRKKVRNDVKRRMDKGDTFSNTACFYWSVIDNLCKIIDSGNDQTGLPPYNGGLFDQQRTPLLADIQLNDAVIAEVIDALSFEQISQERHYINYRDLSVQQLGSIYERLLEQEIVDGDDEITIKPNIFARKDTGSYYTPDDLVSLIIIETLSPSVSSIMDTFATEAFDIAKCQNSKEEQINQLKLLDPAEKILDLKICDPAMGSGHFLVNLVDYLTDSVINAIAEAEDKWNGYVSPLIERIDNIRKKIEDNAQNHKWTINQGQLDDRHIIRRMVLKRCVYGVDKNPMAVELAKVSLWLHTFTVGAPLSFLDHHLRCGDSLFGTWVHTSIEKIREQEGDLFIDDPIKKAMDATTSMQTIEGLTDAEIAEVHQSANVFTEVKEMVQPLNMFLSLNHAFDWLDLNTPEDRNAYGTYLVGTFGNPFDIIQKEVYDWPETSHLAKKHKTDFLNIYDKARNLIADERFLNWQPAFPGIWSDWKRGLTGGFDAVIGNPPWDRVKLQQVEWFAMRQPEIAQAPRAADRKRMINDLLQAEDPLADDFTLANNQSKAVTRMARTGGDYPMLSGGDVNLYSLFVERAMTLVKPDGLIGLLVPSGIASDMTAAKFFKKVSTEGRLKALYDFDNSSVFFPHVAEHFRFCIFVAAPSPTEKPAKCASCLRSVEELNEPDRCFTLTDKDFARVNPNTGTAPIFRTRRDAEITSKIYEQFPVLVDKSSDKEIKTWPLKYQRMIDMTNDSHLFRTRKELEENESAYPIANNRYKSPAGEWVPLYEGKMVQAFDHRAASVVLNPKNLRRPAQGKPTALEQYQNPNWLPNPQYWVLKAETNMSEASYLLGFKHVTAATNSRSMIAALIPAVGAGNSFPIFIGDNEQPLNAKSAALILANLNAIPLDFILRQKVQGQNLNLYIVEQLPVIPLDNYETMQFGSKTAAKIIREAVLELTYTACDMDLFARDMGYVDKKNTVSPPFIWDENRRLCLRAKLDAVFFNLYGITDRDDIRYIYSTFPIIQRQEQEKYDTYRSQELCLAWMNALAAGNPDAEIE